MKSRVLLTVGLALACVLHGSVTGQGVVPVLAMLLAIAAVLAGSRLSLSQASQALVLVGTVGVVFVVAILDVPLTRPEGGPKFQYVIGSGTALLTVGTRLWLMNPERGHPATWIIGVLAFYCCGRVSSELYLPLVLGYLSLAWLHEAWWPGALRALRWRHVATGAAVVVVAGVVATGTTQGLRRLYGVLDELIIGDGGSAAVGFGAGAFRLGSMDGMRQSDEVILRVQGLAPAHFRGQAYAEYVRGFWVPPEEEPVTVARGDSPGENATVIAFVSPGQDRLFLPVGAAAVSVEPPGLAVDALGIPRPHDGAAPVEVRFDGTGAVRFPSPPPTQADLEVPPEVAAAIGPLVASWTAGAGSDADRVARIEARLEQDFTYSLHYERDSERDPVVQFLLESRLGHCEYFASGLALSARVAGVPARVVTGFRATESSPFGGHRIVRSRDAHAWVEAWVDGAWLLVDPSPENSAESSFVASASDDLRVLWERYGLESLVSLLVLVFVGLQIRTLLRDRTVSPVELDEVWIEGPPPYLVALLEVLAGAELERRTGESVEGFADRALAAGLDRAAALLRRYAALRYGGLGDAVALARDVRSWLPAEHRPARG